MLVDRVGLTISDPAGNRRRWADDEPDVDNVPNDLEISSSIPGGDKELSTSLFRDGRVSSPDVSPLNEIRAYGPGNRTRFRGFLARSGDVGSERVTPAAIGDAARLTDNPSLRMIPVDRDYADWGGMSRARKFTALGSTVRGIGDGNVTEDASSGLPAIELLANGAWVANYGPRIESWYDAGPGLKIRRVTASWTAETLAAFLHAGDLRWMIQGGDSDFSPTQFSGKLTPAASGTATLNFSPSVRFASLEMLWNNTTAGGADGWEFGVMFTDVAVYGDHPIPLVDRPLGGPPGVNGEDVLKAVLGLHDCGISYSADSIAAGDFVIPDLKWKSPVDQSTMILDTNRFYQRPWLVRDRLLHWKDSSEIGRLWRGRRSEGVRPIDAGFDSEQLFNGVLVTYTDPSGGSRIVGPPATGLTGPLGLSTAALVDVDETNPVTLAGRTRYAVLDAGVTTEDGAIRLGVYFLELLAARRVSGSVEVGNFELFDEGGARALAGEISAGDRFLLEDVAGAEERFIVEASWRKRDQRATLTLDSPPDRLEAILERLSVNLVGVLA